MSITRWLSILIAIIIVAVLVHWYQITRPTSFFNAYGVEATSTAPVQSLPDYAASQTVTPMVPAAASQAPVSTSNPSASIQNLKNFMHNITIQTNMGTIVFETYDADAPNTVKNFITLSDKGFYNSTIFHRVISGFMIQGGDPTGTGRGGPGYQFADELDSTTPSYKAGYARGTVAMANSGPNTNGSQFFIMHKDYALPHNYTIFGRVTSGMEVVDAIAASPKNADDKPLQDVIMTKVTSATK